MIKRCERNGLSTIIVTFIIILFVLVAVGIVWFVTRNDNSGKPEQASLGKLTADLKISQVEVLNNTYLSVKVDKGTVEGEMKAVNFIFYDKDGKEIKRSQISANNLESNEYLISFRLINTSKIKSIS